MKTCLRWVIGDGKSINIYFDRWLRGKDNLCVDQEANDISRREERVCDFYMRGRKAWDETKIRNTFNNMDAEAILAVHISQSSTCDMIAWVHSSKGQYSVKLGYHHWQSHHATIRWVGKDMAPL